MKKFFGFFTIFFLNIFLLRIISQFFPSKFVILPLSGSIWISFLATALIWTLIIFLTQTIADLQKIDIKNKIEQFIAHFLTNFIALWGIGRIGLGFGVKSIVWVLILAFVANCAQFMVWLLLVKLKFAKM